MPAVIQLLNFSSFWEGACCARHKVAASDRAAMTAALLAWYQSHHRSLEWRATPPTPRSLVSYVRVQPESCFFFFFFLAAHIHFFWPRNERAYAVWVSETMLQQVPSASGPSPPLMRPPFPSWPPDARQHRSGVFSPLAGQVAHRTRYFFWVEREKEERKLRCSPRSLQIWPLPRWKR
jgi:hypothetical protein